MRLENILAMTPDLTPAEIEIGQYMLSHQEEIPSLSIVQLAQKAHASKSTIHRFCQKTGFEGFGQLKIFLAEENAHSKDDEAEIDVNYPFGKDDTCLSIAQKIRSLYASAVTDTFHYIDEKELRNVALLLHGAKAIDFYTHAHNMNVAENFQDKMLAIGRTVNCPASFYKQRATALASSNGHVAVILSYSGKATFIPTIAEILFAKHIPMVLIGRNGCNHHPQYIKRVIYISSKENLRDRISQFSSHIALQYILDVLYGCIYNMDREKNIEYLKNVISVMDDRRL